MDVYWQRPGVTVYIQKYIRNTTDEFGLIGLMHVHDFDKALLPLVLAAGTVHRLCDVNKCVVDV